MPADVDPNRTPRSRTTRMRERTRRRLIDAGRVLVIERGVAGLRIQALTERADVGLGSFYNHFDSKDDLVEAIVSESLSELAAATVPVDWDAAHDDPREIIAGALLRFVRLAHDHPGFARLVVNLSRAQALFGIAVQPYARTALERGIAQGLLTVTSVDVALSVTIGGAFAVIREVLEGRHTPDVDVIVARHCLISFGVAPDEADRVIAATTARAAREGPLRPPAGLVAPDDLERD